ncbi:MAG: CNNM domain-containing protein, partial [Pseudomonadota bacterium]
MASLTEIILSGAWLLPLAILGLLLISSILSGSETGFTGASQAKLHQYAREGNQRAARALSLLHRRHRLIATILFGNNLVNVLASAMASAWFFSIFAEAGILYTTVIMTLLIVVFAEI